MRTFIYILLGMLSWSSLEAQTGFETRIKAIKNEINAIKSEEKAQLQEEVEAINQRLESGDIAENEANILKERSAIACAGRIAARVEPLAEEIQSLIQDEIHHEDEMESIKSDIDSALDDVKASVSIGGKKKKAKKFKNENQTTTQFVFAVGLNNILTDGKLSSMKDNGIKGSTSRFYEWGVTWKTRLIETSPLLNLKYGLSLTYNNLRPDDNTYYAKLGNQTQLAPFTKELSSEPYFRTTNLVVPVHLEFDFSKKIMKDDQSIIKTQKGFRIGIGGYAGINTRAKQVLEYREDGLKNEITSKGKYNTNSFVYGMSGYIGYKKLSLYTKYDLNPLFKSNPVDQNNISFGLRFDFH